MSAVEETIKPKSAVKPRVAPLNRVLDFLSQVRLGVVLLCALVVFAMIGMLIMQQTVEGFGPYYAALTPAEKTIYGALDFFDIYHSWYFNLLLLVLSLNIVLASIDRFPSAWSYLVKPKRTATRPWLLARKEHDTFEMAATTERDAAEAVAAEIKSAGLRSSVVENATGTFAFGESGKFNRIGAYIVHVALLTLFIGYFVALQTGFPADVRMAPGDKTDQIQMIEFNLDKKERFNVKVPFTMECTDISQTLIDPKGSIDVSNTLDWDTQVKIDDPAYGMTVADVSLNKPFSYRGYRFFQAQTIPVGNARQITLELTPENGGDKIHLDVARNGSATLSDGTKVDFDKFEPDFTFGADGQPDTRSGEYNNAAAVLNVTPPGGQTTRVFAFANKLPDNAPVGAAKAGYKWHLASYEKAPSAHILSIKYDPFNAGFIAWYIGGFGLVGALCFVFFFSHKRVWALITKRDDEGRFEVVLAGEANRNQFGFADKFRKIANSLRERSER